MTLPKSSFTPHFSHVSLSWSSLFESAFPEWRSAYWRGCPILRSDQKFFGSGGACVAQDAFAEPLARVNALTRRPPVEEVKTTLRVVDLERDPMTRPARRAGQNIDLLPKEFTQPEVPMRNEGRVVTRTMLPERVRDFHFDPKTSVVETRISRLRARIDRPFDVALLHAVKNVGYPIHAPR